MKRNSKAALAAVAAASLLVVGTSSGAVAAKLITGKQIASGTITTRNLHDGSVGLDQLTSSAKSALKGKTGAKGSTGAKGATGAKGETGAKGATGAPGAPGAKGEQGATGAPGAPGQDAVLDMTDFVTDPNATFHDLPVVLVNPSPVDGTADAPADVLAFHLEPGEYRLDISAQFFHFVPGADGVDYGVLTLTVDGDAAGGPVWTSDIPSSNNAAQVSTWSHVVVGDEGADVVVRGTVRGVRHAEVGAFVTASKIG